MTGDIYINTPTQAALAVLIRTNHVLLVRRKNPPDAGLWGFPGGKIDQTETPQEAAIRELFEETAVTAHPNGVLSSLRLTDHPNDPECTDIFQLTAVLCKWVSGEPKASDDAQEASWLPVQKVLENAYPQSRDVDTVLRIALSRS